MSLPRAAVGRVQNSVAPVGVTLEAEASGALADLTDGTVAIEVYGGNGTARTGWTWTTTTEAGDAGDPIVGKVTPPAGAQGLPNAREVVRVLVVLTLPGQAAREVAWVDITVTPRTGKS